MMDLKELSAPFPAAEIEWRVGSTNGDKTKGLALAYLTARHVMDRLDEMCGPENWQDRYEFHGARTICYLSVRANDEWITKADGAGDSDVEAEKGAISDALKRAAVKFGIGRYLYDLGNIWVELEPAGRSYKIKRDQYAKLERELNSRFGGAVKAVGASAQPEPQKPAPAPSQAAPVDIAALYTRLSKANADCKTKADFNKLWGNANTIAAQSQLSIEKNARLETEKANKFAELEANEPSAYNFDSLQSEHHGDRV